MYSGMYNTYSIPMYYKDGTGNSSLLYNLLMSNASVAPLHLYLTISYTVVAFSSKNAKLSTKHQPFKCQQNTILFLT